MLYSSILDGVEQTLANGKPSFVMARVSDGKNIKDVSILKESFKTKDCCSLGLLKGAVCH